MIIISAIYRFWRRLNCAHYFDTIERIPSADGTIVKKKCVRCEAIEYNHQPARRRG